MKHSDFNRLSQAVLSAPCAKAKAKKYSEVCKLNHLSDLIQRDHPYGMRRIIPEETQLVLHTYSIHRDPRNFHSPEMFLPERWFSTGAPAGEHKVAAFFPFSYGPTNCAGKNLAMMEMRMLLCWVLRRFRFSKAPGVNYEEWEGKILDWFVVHQDPLLVNVSPRE